jgi:hypothetical protein
MANQGLETTCFCSVLMALEEGGMFTVPYLLWQVKTKVIGTVFASKGPRISVASYMQFNTDNVDLFLN